MSSQPGPGGRLPGAPAESAVVVGAARASWTFGGGGFGDPVSCCGYLAVPDARLAQTLMAGLPPIVRVKRAAGPTPGGPGSKASVGLTRYAKTRLARVRRCRGCWRKLAEVLFHRSPAAVHERAG